MDQSACEIKISPKKSQNVSFLTYFLAHCSVPLANLPAFSQLFLSRPVSHFRLDFVKYITQRQEQIEQINLAWQDKVTKPEPSILWFAWYRTICHLSSVGGKTKVISYLYLHSLFSEDTHERGCDGLEKEHLPEKK